MEHLCERLARDLDGTFDDLVGALGDDVYSGLRRMHGDDAADLTQETFIRAYRALGTYDPAEPNPGCDEIVDSDGV